MRVLCRRFVVQYWPWFVLIACQSEALGITCAFLVLVRCNWLLFALVVYVCVAMHAAVVSYIGILSFALCVFSTGQLWVFLFWSFFRIHGLLRRSVCDLRFVELHSSDAVLLSCVFCWAGICACFHDFDCLCASFLCFVFLLSLFLFHVLPRIRLGFFFYGLTIRTLCVSVFSVYALRI